MTFNDPNVLPWRRLTHHPTASFIVVLTKLKTEPFPTTYYSRIARHNSTTQSYSKVTMIDPMANLDPTAPGGNPELNDADASRDVVDMDAYKLNFRKMDKIRSFMGIVWGCVAGVCGLTGLSGLG